MGGDLNIELKLECGGGELQGLDSLDWCGLYCLECRKGGEDLKTCEKSFVGCSYDCVVTSTWSSCDARGEFHWGPREKQMDYILGPRDLQFKKRYSNETWLINWDLYLVVGQSKGTELKDMKGNKGREGWVPKSEEE